MKGNLLYFLIRLIRKVGPVSALHSFEDYLLKKYYAQVLQDEMCVIINGFQKSGNTWLRFLLINYLRCLDTENPKPIGFTELNDLQNSIVGKEVRTNSFPLKILRTHKKEAIALFPKEMIKQVYIKRNAFDTLVSLYHYEKLRDVPFWKYPAEDREKLFDIEYFVEYNLPRLFDHWKHNSINDESNLILWYESLIDDPITNLRSIAEFLELLVNEKSIATAVYLSSKDVLRELARNNGNEKGMAGDNFKGEFIRKGKRGSATDELDSMFIQQMTKKYSNYLTK